VLSSVEQVNVKVMGMASGTLGASPGASAKVLGDGHGDDSTEPSSPASLPETLVEDAERPTHPAVQ
jgi:hypothetical protein